MADEMLEVNAKLRKVVIFTWKAFVRSVCSHPFLVGLLCFLVFLYRTTPFVFSLLVSASPVVVCTAVLLGTLLSFGQPNIPEIQRDEITPQEIVYLKTGLSGDAIAVIEKSKRYSGEKFDGRRGLVIEQINGNKYRTIALHSGGSAEDSNALLVEDSRRDLENEDTVVVGEGGTNIRPSGYEPKNDRINDEKLDYTEPNADDEDFEMENDKSPAESFDSERVNVDSLDSSPGSPWKNVEEREVQEEQKEDDDHTDSESDRAESTSPDASMADIIPMLDELHPLLDEDAPHPPVPLSRDGSDAASKRSVKSSDSSSSESDDNVEKDELEEVADEDNEDAYDEDEGQGNGEGKTKSAITWTEEDQKNLMDLGTSELERNQLLERVIARRIARKTMNIMAERNLRDLENAELPFSIASISTARNNALDLPHNSHDDMGLPPIPGSAPPTILLARRNPFDLAYDSSEEKPDHLGDSFRQEFTAVLPKEPFFRRHESFNVGPSLFGPGKQERPYFVAERMDTEGTSNSSFQRQSSDLSDLKASCIPETDSVASDTKCWR